MSKSDEKLNCPACNKPWVDPETGLWNICDDCPHRTASQAATESVSRKSAKRRLVCGEVCKHPNADIIDLENGLAFCANCPSAGLAKQAAQAQMKSIGQTGPVVEIIHPTPRKTVGHWKKLYLDLLQKHTKLVEELERYKAR